MPKVTIIIPIYNVETYLKQCLNSVINQTLEDIEVICINDGSTDNSINILNDYVKKDSRFKVIEQENLGPGIARNKGIDLATGEYIMFLDPDDWLEINACEIAYEQIKKNQNELVIFNFTGYNEEKNEFNLENWRLKPFEKLFNESNINLRNLEHYILNSFTWTQIYSTNFIQSNKIYFSKGFLGEDVPFFIKSIVCANTISIIPKSLYFYRRSKKSLSSKYEFHWKNLLDVRYECLNFIENYCEKEYYIYPCIIYIINSLLYWYNLSYKNNSIVTKDFYKELRKLFLALESKYDVTRIQQYINYKQFQNICKNSWEINLIKKNLKNLFSITNTNDGKHKQVIALGIKIKIKKAVEEKYA